jgi:hypothetical protein
MTIVVTEDALNAACLAARKSIEDYSVFDSSMVPDDALRTVVSNALDAAVAVFNTPTKGS